MNTGSTATARERPAFAYIAKFSTRIGPHRPQATIWRYRKPGIGCAPPLASVSRFAIWPHVGPRPLYSAIFLAESRFASLTEVHHCSCCSHWPRWQRSAIGLHRVMDLLMCIDRFLLLPFLRLLVPH